MAKRVRLAYPYDMVGGRMLPKQKLVYAENDNPAWDAPEGKQYARNYRPNIVMRYTDKTEKQTFFIKTKSSVDNTEAGRLRLALFGGSQAIKNAMKKNPTLLAQAYEAYVEVRNYFKSFDSFLVKEIRKGLKTKTASILLGNSTGDGIYINNPWVAGGTGTNVTISAEIAAKFALYLAPYVFTLDGEKFASPGKQMYHICTDPVSGDTPYSGWYGNKFALKYGGDMILEEDEILYNGSNIYKGSTKCMGNFQLTNGDTLSTTAPNE